MTPPRRCGRRACECWGPRAIRPTSRRSWRGRTIPSQEVRVAVAFSLTRLGEHDGAATVAADIARLAVGEMAHDRVLAALMLHECDPEARIDRAPLGAAPRRSEITTWCARRWRRCGGPRTPPCSRRWSATSPIGRRPRPPSSRSSEPGRPRMGVVDDGLSSDALDRRVQELFVRVARDVGGPAAIAVLRDHIEHRDPDIGLAVMRALAAIEPPDAVVWLPRRTHGSWRSCPATSSTPRTCSAPWSRSMTSRPLTLLRAALARRARPAVPAGHRGAVDATRHRRPRPCRLPARPARRALTTRSRSNGST